MRKGVGLVVVAAGVYIALVGLSSGGLRAPWSSAGPQAPGSPAGQDVAWVDSYANGMQRARAEDRPVLIDFFADWCVYCKKLDSETFSDKRVAAEAKRFVTIRVNADRHADVVRQYKVLGLPTLVFLDSAGAEAARIESYVKADELLRRMESIK